MKIIGITGGKGGTGKSTVSTALAFELAKSHKVLLVDADVDCPNDHLLLNIDLQLKEIVEQRIPLFDEDACIKCGKCGRLCRENAIIAIKGRVPIFEKSQCNGCGACHHVCPSNAISWDKKSIGRISSGINHNINLLSGDLNANEPISELIVNRLNDIVRDEIDNYDYILIDTAAGTHCPVIAALEMCDYIFAVTEPTPLGSHDLELILKLIQILGKNANIIINRDDIGNRALIEELSSRYSMPILAGIPFSMDIVNSYANGIPVEIPETQKLIDTIKKGSQK